MSAPNFAGTRAAGVALALLTTSVASGQIVVAHRGASHLAPENTLSAFRLAWQKGSDGIEGDFYLTADRQIVCIHDKDTERTGKIKRSVEQSTLAQLRELEYGSWKSDRYRGEPIPTLEQVLETVPEGKTFVIELKSKSKIVPVLVEQLKKLPTESIRLVVIAFDEATAAKIKQRLPQIKVHWLTSFKQDEATGEFHPTAREIAETVRRIGVDGVGMKGQREVIDEAFVNQLAEGGCGEFHVWTIDDVNDAAYFQSLGACGITTNRPGMIGAALRQ